MVVGTVPADDVESATFGIVFGVSGDFSVGNKPGLVKFFLNLFIGFPCLADVFETRPDVEGGFDVRTRASQVVIFAFDHIAGIGFTGDNINFMAGTFSFDDLVGFGNETLVVEQLSDVLFKRVTGRPKFHDGLPEIVAGGGGGIGLGEVLIGEFMNFRSREGVCGEVGFDLLEYVLFVIF